MRRIYNFPGLLSNPIPICLNRIFFIRYKEEVFHHKDGGFSVRGSNDKEKFASCFFLIKKKAIFFADIFPARKSFKFIISLMYELRWMHLQRVLFAQRATSKRKLLHDKASHGFDFSKIQERKG